MLIKIRQYEHFNRALGKHIKSKQHYEEEMAKGGYVSFKEGCKIAEKVRKNSRKRYEVGKDVLDIIRSAKVSSKNGKIKCGDRLIDAMKKVGVNFDHEHCPKHYQPKGGFK